MRMGPKKKEPPAEGKRGKEGGEKEQGSKKGGEKGRKGKDGDVPLLADEGSAPTEDAELLPPAEPFCPPAVVTPEFVYNTALSLEELQEIYALSDISLEDAARKLALILGLGDCVFDARNLILLEYCLGNLMFAKQASLNVNQALEIYDLGHMVLDLIRAEKPFADAERLFKNRLLSRSIVQYKTVASDPTQKENDQPKENNQPKEDDEEKDAQKQKETKNKKSKDTEKPNKEGKKSKKGKKSAEADKPEEANKSKKDDDKSKDSNGAPDGGNVDEPKQDDNFEEPLFSRLDVKRITPYFTSTVFQHYCLYEYCFNRVHYNIRRSEKVFAETALTCPLSEAKSQQEVDTDEAARIAAEEKAIQDAYAAQWRAEQSLFESLAAEARRLAEEELSRRALTLDEYIERAVCYRIEEAKKELIEEYEYREHFLIDKILQRQQKQEAAAAAAAAAAALAAKNATAAEKAQPAAPAVAEKKEKETKKKKGKSA